jgi:bifunctional UDP-N-acetylglucosamine pyrophosphorylase/glucosamine-1-phosphate N-acetyltransferase
MRSRLPKVLHTLAGKPLLGHVADAAAKLDPEQTVVVFGHGGARVPEALPDPRLRWVEQAQQLGTGHAVMQALPMAAKSDKVLILYGDVPLISEATLKALVAATGETSLALLTVCLQDPCGYGRIVRDAQGRIERIVEHKDATEEQRSITEINTGILVADRSSLERWLGKIGTDNTQGEYYLTDIIALAVAEGVDVRSVSTTDTAEVMGVNDPVQLALLERVYQRAQAEAVMRRGVTLYDPARFDLRGRLEAGQDVVIDINVLLEGDVALGSDVYIGANAVIRNARIGAGVQILENSVIEDAVIGDHCRIGPFARIRPQTRLSNRVHVGNFVEIKKTEVAAGSKINHLSYVGDTSVGSGVNIGAGTITCNYDGANKYRTIIGDNAFIGSDTQLVAPVEVGAGATIGAGSTITRDAPADTLTLSRAGQESIPGWKRPLKAPKK